MGALKPGSTLRDHSRFRYTIPGESATMEETNCGSLERIADACELMAKNYLELQQRAEQYKQWFYYERERRSSLERRLSRAKGEITKLKKRMGE